MKEIADGEVAVMVETARHDRAVGEHADLVAQTVAEHARSPVLGRYVRPVELLPGFEPHALRQSRAIARGAPRAREVRGEDSLNIGVEGVQPVFVPQTQDAQLPRRVHLGGEGGALVYITV